MNSNPVYILPFDLITKANNLKAFVKESRNMKGPKDYYSEHMIIYAAPKSTGHLSLPVLQFIWGQPWDQLALDLIESLNPLCIRVSTGCVTCDSCPGRVTVTVDEFDKIINITREGNVANGTGSEVNQKLLERGINLRKILWGHE